MDAKYSGMHNLEEVSVYGENAKLRRKMKQQADQMKQQADQYEMALTKQTSMLEFYMMNADQEFHRAKTYRDLLMRCCDELEALQREYDKLYKKHALLLEYTMKRGLLP